MAGGSRQGWRRTYALAVAALTLAIPLAAPAFAGAFKIREVSATKKVPADFVARDITATCPKGYAVAGGGIRNADRSGGVYFQGSYPSAAGIWSAASVRLRSVGAGSATTHAICLKGRAVVQRKRTVPFDETLVRTSARIQCAGKSRVIGGGIGLSDENDDFVASTYPASNGWRASGVQGVVQKSSFTVSTLCARRLKVRKVSHSRPFSDSGKRLTASAECPKHFSILNGGTKLPQSADGYFTSSYPGHHRWISRGFGSTGKLTSYALCVKR